MEERSKSSLSHVTQYSDESYYDEPEKKGTACRAGCVKLLKFFFTHIGSFALAVGYSIAGGYIFSLLEQPNEKDGCISSRDSYNEILEKTKSNIWKLAQAYADEVTSAGDVIVTEAYNDIRKNVRSYRDSVIDTGYEMGYDCDKLGEPGGPQYSWNLPMSILFAVTIVTTIGYGNISPSTYWGKITTIAYSLLGIPIMLIVLANIGNVMADIFKYVYTQMCCCGCCRRKNKARGTPPPSPNGPSPEAWKNQYGEDPVIIEDEEEEEEDDSFSVPITITIALLASYILIGALLFGKWEGWSPMDASYFSFITISTIGFGDMVPGAAAIAAGITDTNDQLKLVASSIYILLGLALLSMCLTLIQEEIAGKFIWIGSKMGISSDDQDMGEEEEEELMEEENNGELEGN